MVNQQNEKIVYALFATTHNFFKNFEGMEL